ncbi:hypothetical protein FRUB_09625 [Fimbriiglobus ruber]|uniref:Uncharacterized protein n=1 Tax=Fimbriiglobus ruber TaxID=1908690 RepID=A0A225D1I1_9BACT|nr:hypothetical protein FRUB_09625 [Fimbriiglobus ruber]
MFLIVSYEAQDVGKPRATNRRAGGIGHIYAHNFVFINQAKNVMRPSFHYTAHEFRQR